MQNSVKFEGYMIQKLNLEKIEKIPKEKQKNINISCNYFKKKEKSKENLYKVSMNIEIYTNLSKIELVLDGFFMIPQELEEENKKYFLEVSAPAIIYPYARTLISNITAFDADETILLPVINFAGFKLNNK